MYHYVKSSWLSKSTPIVYNEFAFDSYLLLSVKTSEVEKIFDVLKNYGSKCEVITKAHIINQENQTDQKNAEHFYFLRLLLCLRYNLATRESEYNKYTSKLSSIRSTLLIILYSLVKSMLYNCLFRSTQL